MAIVWIFTSHYITSPLITSHHLTSHPIKQTGICQCSCCRCWNRQKIPRISSIWRYQEVHGWWGNFYACIGCVSSNDRRAATSYQSVSNRTRHACNSYCTWQWYQCGKSVSITRPSTITSQQQSQQSEQHTTTVTRQRSGHHSTKTIRKENQRPTTS